MDSFYFYSVLFKDEQLEVFLANQGTMPVHLMSELPKVGDEFEHFGEREEPYCYKVTAVYPPRRPEKDDRTYIAVVKQIERTANEIHPIE